MSIMKISSSTNNSLINLAKSLLLNDKIIALPTDTIYGLAADIESNKAIQRLYEIKSRNFNNPLSICVADVEEIFKYADVTISSKLLNQLLPGAITVIFNRTKDLNPFLNADTSLVGIRIPDYHFIRQLCRISGPIALTSANLSSQTSCLNVNEFKHMWPKIDGIFDGGTLGQIDPQRLGSTIIDFSTKGCYRIVRNGCVYKQAINIIEQYDLEHLI